MTIDELVDNFSLLEDWEQRYGYLIELGGTLPAMDLADKNELNKVQGCVSQVWMIPFFDQKGGFDFIADSDAQIVRGLIAVLRVAFVGRPREELARVNIDDLFIRLGLDSHLSPNRRNGFYSMVAKIKALSS